MLVAKTQQRVREKVHEKVQREELIPTIFEDNVSLLLPPNGGAPKRFTFDAVHTHANAHALCSTAFVHASTPSTSTAETMWERRERCRIECPFGLAHIWLG